MVIVLALVFIIVIAWGLYALCDYLDWYIAYRKRHKQYEQYKNYKGDKSNVKRNHYYGKVDA